MFILKRLKLSKFAFVDNYLSDCQVSAYEVAPFPALPQSLKGIISLDFVYFSRSLRECSEGYREIRH